MKVPLSSKTDKEVRCECQEKNLHPTSQQNIHSFAKQDADFCLEPVCWQVLHCDTIAFVKEVEGGGSSSSAEG